LQQAALAAQQRTAAAEARQAAALSAFVAEQDRRTQALADLASILDTAGDTIREALPDAEVFSSVQAGWLAALNGVGLSVSAWSSTPRAVAAGRLDPLAAGDVRLWRQRPTAGEQIAPMANIACELDGDGRLAWSLLRFTGISPNYQLGPLDLEHGFDERTFAQQRIYMLGGMHIWTCNKYILTADIISRLLSEAIGRNDT
jgi:hypothetical protein